MSKIIAFFKDKELLRKFLYLIFGLIIFRILASIPIPQVDIGTLAALIETNQFLGVFNIFSGGGLSNFSIGLLGVFPYITVAIVTQLLTAVFPPLHSMYHEEGEIGRKKVGQWMRVATLPIALVNATGILIYFKSQGIFPFISNFDFITTIIIIATGSMLLMWIGELLTEFAIGNGISFIVFAGIVVNIPTIMSQIVISYTSSLIPLYIVGAIGVVLFVAIAVLMNEGNRPIPLTYARYGVGHSTGRKVETYLPIKVNPVGVLSIIFALTLGAFLQILSQFMANSSLAFLSGVGTKLTEILAVGYYYAIPVAFLTIFFTYFHAPIVFNTKKIATNLQKQGAFVPGLRPGDETIKYLNTVLFNVIFYAAAFLTVVSVVPFIITGSTAGTFLFAIGGTGLLIVVSVVLDISRRVGSRLTVV